MRKYVAYARKYVQPKLSPQAADLLQTVRLKLFCLLVIGLLTANDVVILFWLVRMLEFENLGGIFFAIADTASLSSISKVSIFLLGSLCSFSPEF